MPQDGDTTIGQFAGSDDSSHPVFHVFRLYFFINFSSYSPRFPNKTFFFTTLQSHPGHPRRQNSVPGQRAGRHQRQG